MSDALLLLASIVNGVDYAVEGRTLERLGLGGLGIDELQRGLQTGDV